MVDRIIKTDVVKQTLRTREGTPDLVQGVLALLKVILKRSEIACAMGKDELPDVIGASLAWPSDHGHIQGGRLTLTLEALDAEEFAADKAEREAVF